MGIDIHAFIETSSDEIPFSKSVKCIAEMHLSRNREIFSAISSYGIDAPLFESRGIPDTLSVVAEESVSVYVIDECEEEEHKGAESYKRSEVDKWISNGESTYQLDFMGKESKNFAYNKDCKFISWLTRTEIKKALRFHNIVLDEYTWVYKLMLDTMQQLEKRQGKRSIRLFFWFDM